MTTDSELLCKILLPIPSSVIGMVTQCITEVHPKCYVVQEGQHLAFRIPKEPEEETQDAEDQESEDHPF